MKRIFARILEKILGKKKNFFPVVPTEKVFPIVEENSEIQRLIKLRRKGIYGNGLANQL